MDLPRVVIDLDAIKRRLYEQAQVSRRIAGDFGIAEVPTCAGDFATRILLALNQPCCDQPLDQTHSNGVVFRAAVRSLGSNNRTWASFLRVEARLRDLLCDFDPVEAHKRLYAGRDLVGEIRRCLPGLSCGADVGAIANWASILAVHDNYYDRLRQLGRQLDQIHRQEYGIPLRTEDMLHCLVGFLTSLPPDGSGQLTKPPGMRLALTSEFLRNLGWSGFKVDRHIQRLFDRWFPEVPADTKRIEVAERVVSLALQRYESSRKLANRSRFRTYARYSLLGIQASPDGVPYSRVDNLVWLLGAYVERKGRETSTQYVRQIDPRR